MAQIVQNYLWVHKNGYIRTFGAQRGAGAIGSGMHKEKAELIYDELAKANISAEIVQTVETAHSESPLYEVRLEPDIHGINRRHFLQKFNANGRLDLRDDQGIKFLPPAAWLQASGPERHR